MESIMITDQLYQKVNYVQREFWSEYGDPRVNHLPFMENGPWKVAMISLIYLFFAKMIGPQFMERREPFKLRNVMMVHNLVLIVLNGIGFVTAFWATSFGADAFSCEPMDTNDRSTHAYLLIGLGYTYFLTKLVDLLDTVFFVLRKKSSHVSALHVFHHCIMPLIAWTGVKFYPGGNSAFVPLVNVFVHTIMYTYYLLASFGPQMAPYLWWKKHITQIQLVQFTLVFGHSLYSLIKPDCHWPKMLALLEGLQALLFFAMFADFYLQQYNDRVRCAKQAIQQSTYKEKVN